MSLPPPVLRSRSSGKTFGVLLFAAGSLLLAACSGTREVRGLPPLVRVGQLQALAVPPQVTLRVQNPNGVPLAVTRFDLEFIIDGDRIALDSQGLGLEIIAYSAEEIAVPITLEPPLGARLAAANIDDQPGWEISGKLIVAEGHDSPFRAAGLFYPIPGVAGAWRATTTDSGFEPQRRAERPQFPLPRRR